MRLDTHPDQIVVTTSIGTELGGTDYVKAGPGLVQLQFSSNTYTGTTTVSGGS